MKHIGSIAALGLAFVATAAAAQIERDPRDKLVAPDATGAAASYKGQPWWAPLSECAAVFASGDNKEKFQQFAGYAMMRVADDRKLKAEEAAALVLPYTQKGAAFRADIMTSNFGRAPVEANCDTLFEQYRAL